MRLDVERHFNKAAAGLGRYAKDARALTEALALSRGREAPTAADVDEAVSLVTTGQRMGMRAFLAARRPELLALSSHPWTEPPKRRSKDKDE